MVQVEKVHYLLLVFYKLMKFLLHKTLYHFGMSSQDTFYMWQPLELVNVIYALMQQKTQKPNRSNLVVVPTFFYQFPTLISNSKLTASLNSPFLRRFFRTLDFLLQTTQRLSRSCSPPNHRITPSLSFFCSSRSRHARFVSS